MSKPAQTIISADLTMSGEIGPETIQLISKTFSLPPEQTLRAPVSVSNAHVVWEAGEKLAIVATAAIEDGPTLSVAMNKDAMDLAINELMIYDEESRENITFSQTTNLIDGSFQGTLSEKTLKRIFQQY